MLRFGTCPIGLPVHAQQARQFLVGPVRQQPQRPPEERRRYAQRRDRVPDIVLAVSECALAVLPRLPPLNRGQRHEESLAAAQERPQGSRRKNRALLECVLARRVVKDAPVVDDVSLGWMQVSAGRVDAQRPTRVPIGLPCRQAHRIAQEPPHRLASDWGGGYGVNSPTEGADWRRLPRKRDERRALVPAKWIGLRRPIQIPARSGESTEVVLGGLVVVE